MASGSRSRWREPGWREAGQEPDYRFTLANERTFLAWIRSALALMAGGVVLAQFATHLAPRSLVTCTAAALTALSGGMAAVAWRRWRANEIAMRHGRPLPAGSGPLLLAASICIVAAVLTTVQWLG